LADGMQSVDLSSQDVREIGSIVGNLSEYCKWLARVATRHSNLRLARAFRQEPLVAFAHDKAAMIVQFILEKRAPEGFLPAGAL
jgi:hypothetical protein